MKKFNTSEELHELAMEYCERADIAKRNWRINSNSYELEIAKARFTIAMLLEKQAADFLITTSSLTIAEREPSRSVLCRSTAALANEVLRIDKDDELAREIRSHYANFCISFNYDSEIVEEAREILEEIK